MHMARPIIETTISKTRLAIIYPRFCLILVSPQLGDDFFFVSTWAIGDPRLLCNITFSFSQNIVFPQICARLAKPISLLATTLIENMLSKKYSKKLSNNRAHTSLLYCNYNAPKSGKLVQARFSKKHPILVIRTSALLSSHCAPCLTHRNTVHKINYLSLSLQKHSIMIFISESLSG